MLKGLILAAVGIAISTSALARDCDQDTASDKWEQAEEKKIVLGAGMVNDVPSFAVDETIWGQVDLSTRRGMVTTFECMVAGPDNILAKANVINKGGKVLAVWDGVSRKLEIK